jgi:transcriptional regulator of acetoin/glycerol metabolism
MARDRIIAVLEETGRSTRQGVRWNVALAARHLGTSRATLYTWMERYGIERGGDPSAGDATLSLR